MMRYWFLSACLCAASLTFGASSSSRVQVLYNSLDPKSVSHHLALYALYPETPEGKRALQEAWDLLMHRQGTASRDLLVVPFERNLADAIVSLVNKPSESSIPKLTEGELRVVSQIGATLPNRRLRGYQAKGEEEIFLLPSQEIDLARGLLLSQLGKEKLHEICCYEAVLDLMACQVRARLPDQASAEVKVRTLNDFIFGELSFRFPPHSLYAKDIDLYTFLPSVLDGRRGVCLGVSILYLCLAQRLDLPLEMITPPGHIYVRYREGQKTINIETTARGVHLDSEEYLTLNTRALQQRTMKEVIGLAHMNHAAVYWDRDQPMEALAAYKRAHPYLQQDELLLELLGYAYLVAGSENEGKELLNQIKDRLPDHCIVRDTMAVDYLQGRVDVSGVRAIFRHVDETRSSVLEKRDALLAVLEHYPQFRAGWFALAAAWLQLHRQRESVAALQRYHLLEPNDPTAEYYLSILYAENLDYRQAWSHLRNAERIVASRNYQPKSLRELRRELGRLSPEQ